MPFRVISSAFSRKHRQINAADAGSDRGWGRDEETCQENPAPPHRPRSQRPPRDRAVFDQRVWQARGQWVSAATSLCSRSLTRRSTSHSGCPNSNRAWPWNWACCLMNSSEAESIRHKRLPRSARRTAPPRRAARVAPTCPLLLFEHLAALA